ncbi:MAG: hypothetical protein CBC83_09620 [Flavobacteriales bacterium TMED123]|nr:MAG: hypothetical protein CBC83_09620 [Flavobacteriales bacterium TMED123]
MKRPWNRTNSNIYSLLTHNLKGETNMNICTYVSVVNMNPRLYAVSIDYNTLTYKNLISSSGNVVLQCLGKKNIRLIRSLGKKSGLVFDKMAYLKKNQLITNWNNFIVLKDVAFLVELKAPKKIHEMSDHTLFLFSVKSYKNSKNEILVFNDLIEKKIIL